MASSSLSLVVVLALAHRRMVVGDFADLTAANLVEPRIAHVSHHRRAVVEHRHGKHAGHPLPFRIAARGAQNLVIRHGDGFAHALFRGAGLPFQARPHAAHGDLGGLLARGLPADAVHHQENAALRVDMQRVFVVLAHRARVATRPRIVEFGD